MSLYFTGNMPPSLCFIKRASGMKKLPESCERIRGGKDYHIHYSSPSSHPPIIYHQVKTSDI